MSDIIMVKGDTAVFDVPITRYNPTTDEYEPVSLTGAKAWFTAKRNSYEADDTNAVIAKNSTDDPANVAMSSNVVRVIIDPEDTEDYPDRWLVYDLQIKEADGTVTTVEYGSIEFVRDRTKATT